jgi:predicted RNA binding protein YcfA (HicA-like mRNA interferase family)
MKLPRNLSGEDLAKALERLGYQVTRQTGFHRGGEMDRMAVVVTRLVFQALGLGCE